MFRVSSNAIRYYNDCGILTPSRKKNNYRSYNDEDILSALSIMSLRTAGVPVNDIHKIFDSVDAKVLLESLSDTEHKLIIERERLERKVAFIDQLKDDYEKIKNGANLVEIKESPPCYYKDLPADPFKAMEAYNDFQDRTGSVCHFAFQPDYKAFQNNKLEYIYDGFCIISKTISRNITLPDYSYINPRSCVHTLYVGEPSGLEDHYQKIWAWMRENDLLPDIFIKEVFILRNKRLCAIDIWIPIKG